MCETGVAASEKIILQNKSHQPRALWTQCQPFLEASAQDLSKGQYRMVNCITRDKPPWRKAWPTEIGLVSARCAQWLYRRVPLSSAPSINKSISDPVDPKYLILTDLSSTKAESSLRKEKDDKAKKPFSIGVHLVERICGNTKVYLQSCIGYSFISVFGAPVGIFDHRALRTYDHSGLSDILRTCWRSQSLLFVPSFDRPPFLCSLKCGKFTLKVEQSASKQ